MANMDIKQEAKRAEVKLWEVAEGIGISDSAFSRKLRWELTEIEKETIRKIITELKARVRNINGEDKHNEICFRSTTNRS